MAQPQGLQSLSGRRVLVTGAGSGIGLEIATVLLDYGCRVYAAESSNATVIQAQRDHPHLTVIETDVADAAAVARLFERIASEAGGLDVLVNNAGIGGPACPIETISEAEWDRTVAVNLSGMFYCLKQAVLLMKPKRSGIVINISTACTRTGLPNRLAYVASKTGVEGLTRNAARELGPFGIRCNAILPGLVDNPRGIRLVERLARDEGLDFEAAKRKFVSYVSLRSMIPMREIAEMVAFLASDAAKLVTGQLIGVDGNLEWEV